MNYADRLLTCSDCKQDFVFSAGEQLFFADKQFRNEPKRCRTCRVALVDKKMQPGTGPRVVKSPRTETRAICSQCNVETILPFKPTNGRPVLCRQCFDTIRPSTASRAPEPTQQS
jgi:CxxC-x17-CxxC domain-containing protein